MTIEPTVALVPLAALHPAPWNPRTIRDERFKNLCDSITADPAFIWRRPILAQLDGTIYAGNMRYRAAEHLGMTEIPSIVEDVPDTLAKERALRDNAQWGDWQDDELARLLAELHDAESNLDLLGIEEAELKKLLAGPKVELTDPDDVPPTPDEPTTKRGDLWLLGEHRLLCGDATKAADVGRLMDGEQASLMATDPPYLVDYKGGSHPTSNSNAGVKNKDKDWSDSYHEIDIRNAEEFFDGFLARARDIALIEKAAWYVWHASARQSDLEASLNRTGVNVHQQIIWVKSRPVLTYSHYMWRHEPCFYGWIEGKQPELRPPASVQTVWEIESGLEDSGKSIHPTQKPVEIFGRPIEYHTAVGGVCYEPFSGSGTQIISAERLGRRCYAIEIEPRYVDVAVRRWEEFTGKKAVLDAAAD